jgi:hypothetical protein
MTARPYKTKTLEERLNEDYASSGGYVRFMQIYNEPIPFEAKMRLLVDEFKNEEGKAIAYRTAMRWYYKEKERQANV